MRCVPFSASSVAYLPAMPSKCRCHCRHMLNNIARIYEIHPKLQTKKRLHLTERVLTPSNLFAALSSSSGTLCACALIAGFIISNGYTHQQNVNAYELHPYIAVFLTPVSVMLAAEVASLASRRWGATCKLANIFACLSLRFLCGLSACHCRR
eukprot:SAG11_NODE_235_length_11852_cov_4.266020_6_plen_153_part_00